MKSFGYEVNAPIKEKFPFLNQIFPFETQTFSRLNFLLCHLQRNFFHDHEKLFLILLQACSFFPLLRLASTYVDNDEKVMSLSTIFPLTLHAKTIPKAHFVLKKKEKLNLNFPPC